MSESSSTSQPPESAESKFAKRDAETQVALGLFISVIAVPVLIGTLWADTFHAQVVNGAAGLVLLAIGLVIAGWGYRAIKRMSKRS